MKVSHRHLPAGLLVSCCIVAPCLAQDPSARTPGVNLGGGVLNYDNSSLVFADLIKGSGTFNGFRGVSPTPAYDPSGWPSRVDALTGSTTLVVGLNANLPAGIYTLTAKGVGKIRLSGGFDGKTWQEVVFNGDELPRTVFRPYAGVTWNSVIFLEITQSSASNHLRDISFVMPNHIGKTFYDGFLDDLKPFSTLRFMDWQATNGSTQVDWTDRDSQKFSYYLRKRVNEEVACELANTIYRDIWISIPAMASDDYVRRLARLIDLNLAPYLRIYVEFSNEVWNNAFPQYSQLKALRLQDSQRLAGDWEWIAHRDGRLVNLFKANLSPDRECIRVLARQAGYPATLTVALKQYRADGYQFDALSCAGYFVSKANLNTATTLYKTNPAEAITSVINGMYGSMSEALTQISWYKSMADVNGVPLVLYEAGQHLNNSQNNASTSLLMDVNRDSRMGLAYTYFIDSLPESLGGICWYNDAGTYSKWGCWGLKEKTGQSLSTAHKYRAVIARSSLVQIPPPPAPSATYAGFSAMPGFDNLGLSTSHEIPPANFNVESFGGFNVEGLQQMVTEDQR
ncbi:hypothetical protein P12x_006121 (plasmid) [Tundrisphaera lichenicola]|uniref:hypothetical protein n=1 Tax=Tundrisphaera lichenicola TaxID=2029860 RepID=UPI003EB8DC0E